MIRITPLRRRLLGLDHSDFHPERLVNRSHQFRVASRQVVVDRRQHRPFTAEGVKIHRRGRREGFSLPRLHFNDRVVKNGDSAEHLHVEMAHTDISDRSLSNQGERFGKKA